MHCMRARAQVRNPGLDLSGPRAEVIPTIAKLLQEDEQQQQL